MANLKRLWWGPHFAWVGKLPGEDTLFDAYMGVYFLLLNYRTCSDAENSPLGASCAQSLQPSLLVLITKLSSIYSIQRERSHHKHWQLAARK